MRRSCLSLALAPMLVPVGAAAQLVSDYQPVIDAAAKYGVLPKAFPASEFFYR